MRRKNWELNCGNNKNWREDGIGGIDGVEIGRLVVDGGALIVFNYEPISGLLINYFDVDGVLEDILNF